MITDRGYRKFFEDNGYEAQPLRWFVRIDATENAPEIRAGFYTRMIAEAFLGRYVAEGRTGIVVGRWPDDYWQRRNYGV